MGARVKMSRLRKTCAAFCPTGSGPEQLVHISKDVFARPRFFHLQQSLHVEDKLDTLLARLLQPRGSRAVFETPPPPPQTLTGNSEQPFQSEKLLKNRSARIRFASN